MENSITFFFNWTLPLDGVKSDLILSSSFLLPKSWKKTLIGFFFMATGSNIYVWGLLKMFELDRWVFIMLIISNFFSLMNSYLYWFISLMLVEIWIENINNIIRTNEFIKSYKIVGSALGSFFLIYFAFYQLLSISIPFMCASKFVLKVMINFVLENII